MSACPKHPVLTDAESRSNNRECSLRVWPMRPSDLEQVAALEERVYDFPWSRNVFLSCFGNGYESRVLEFERRIVGYGVMLVAAGECHLVNLCVEPELRRRGFARTLLRLMLEQATTLGARCAILEVRQSNTAAHALYVSENFNELSKRKNYYPTATGREDALLLGKLL